MKKIVVIGGGGHAKVVISLIKKIDKFEIVGYTDEYNRGTILGVEHVGKDDCFDTLRNQNISAAAIGIGQIEEYERRKYIIDMASEHEFDFPPIISPGAIINEGVEIGRGTVVMDGSVINAGVKIGEFSIINTGAKIDHDSRIGNYSHIAPGVTVCGGVEIGDFTFIGAGSIIIQNIKISPKVFIGAGSLVVMNCLLEGRYLGNPIKKI